MKTGVFIPARYGSSRFPGKPLAKIGGEEMVIRVCRQAAKACDTVVVATDDERIAEVVERNGFRAIMTSAEHRSGTDRIREAYEKSGLDIDVIVNVQGDEPFINPEQIRQVISLFEQYPDAKLATLSRRFNPEKGFEALFDKNLVKVVMSDTHDALYFSRSIIPYVRGEEWQKWLECADFHTHIGIYGYKTETLREITNLPPSSLEKSESLEQLRWLQAGYKIKIAVSDFPTIGIDTPEDLAEAEKLTKFDK